MAFLASFRCENFHSKRFFDGSFGVVVKNYRVHLMAFINFPSSQQFDDVFVCSSSAKIFINHKKLFSSARKVTKEEVVGRFDR
jgi:hypothetical protein